MRKTLAVSENIQAKTQWTKLTVVDGFMIIGSLGVGYVLKGIVYPLFQFPFMAFIALATTYFLWPSIDSPNKKNYQVAWLVIKKDRRTYKAQEPIGNFKRLIRGDEDGV
ncbi:MULTISPECIES: DUF5592 family protein [Bacillus subtilis group]|uniref:DUF5592 family protein n=1 Tax=Bacillus subtilis group TaxID=653685 RepID=UPI0007795508|nr:MULTISPECIES: DUF5592 family protein [Bacillus subtilis group]MBW7636334.1 hypothetical protein [Bacillus licheniformis]MCY8151974.1 DUF5592 family protein [Bacillus paralicheniformis]MEC1428695.1 DUF5592 family protein [Bacillus sonorensis]MED4505092.1 DUF5592 family protein [Bacillus licheniformis]